MHVGTGGDVLGREADNLTVFAHRGTGGDRLGGDFMAGRDRLDTGDAFRSDIRPRQHFGPRHHHIIGGVQADR